MYPVPDVLVGIYQNIIPLYSLIMSKQNSSVELVGTDKKRKKEYTIKTVSYPDLPILHFNKKSKKCSMEFPPGYNGLLYRLL